MRVGACPTCFEENVPQEGQGQQRSGRVELSCREREREQPICTASRWQLMESLSGTAVSSTVAIVGSIWPKGPAQAGPAIQAQWSLA